MSNLIRIRRSDVSGMRPHSLAVGELGLNRADGNLYYSKSAVNDIHLLASDRATRSALHSFFPVFLNGNFQVWQRGVVIDNPHNLTYLADMWNIFYDADGGVFPSITHAQKMLRPEEVCGSFYFYLLYADDTGNNLGPDSYYILRNFIEKGTRYLAGSKRQLYVTFYGWTDMPDKRIGIFLTQTYGTGGSPHADEIIRGQTVKLTNVWTRYTIGFELYELFGKRFGSNEDDTLIVNFMYQWGINNAGLVNSLTIENFDRGHVGIAQVRVNRFDNSEVELFRPLDFNTELRLCQRYYEKSYNYFDPPGTVTHTGTQSARADRNINPFASGQLRPTAPVFAVPKRVTPVVTLYASTASTANAITVDASDVRTGCYALYPGQSTLFSRIRVDNTGSKQIQNNDRIEYHWTADASF